MKSQPAFLTGALVRLGTDGPLLIVREALGDGAYFLCDYADEHGNSRGPREGRIPRISLLHASLPPTGR